jgi:hypothetical protein
MGMMESSAVPRNRSPRRAPRESRPSPRCLRRCPPPYHHHHHHHRPQRRQQRQRKVRGWARAARAGRRHGTRLPAASHRRRCRAMDRRRRPAAAEAKRAKRWPVDHIKSKGGKRRTLFDRWVSFQWRDVGCTCTMNELLKNADDAPLPSRLPLPMTLPLSPALTPLSTT